MLTPRSLGRNRWRLLVNWLVGNGQKVCVHWIFNKTPCLTGTATTICRKCSSFKTTYLYAFICRVCGITSGCRFAFGLGPWCVGIMSATPRNSVLCRIWFGPESVWMKSYTPLKQTSHRHITDRQPTICREEIFSTWSLPEVARAYTYPILHILLRQINQYRI